MKYVLLVVIALFVHSSFSQVWINEVQSSNSTTIADDFGEFDDWIEIYNPTANTIEIGGLVLKDQLDTWMIPTGDPSTLLAPGGYFLLWADDQEIQGIFHTNFKLSASNGEFLGLYESDSVTIIDSLSIPPLLADQSFARCDSVTWLPTNSATPLTENGCAMGVHYIDPPQDAFNVSYYKGGHELQIEVLGVLENNSFLSVYSMDGKKVIELLMIAKSIIIDLDNFGQGIYLVNLTTPKLTQSKKIRI